MNRKLFLLSSAAAVAASPQVARAQLNTSFGQQFAIAVNVPLSGDGAVAGQQIAHGVQAAIDETNRIAGSYSTLFTMRPLDDLGALAQAMVNVQIAAADSEVVGTVVGFDGSLISASLPSYAQAQMPVIVPASTADPVTGQGYHNVWRLPTKDSLEGQMYARFLGSHGKPKNALAVTQDGDYGFDVARGFLAAAKSSGFPALGYAFTYDKPDYAAAAATIIAKKPDYVLLCGETSMMGPLIPALRAAGYAGTFGATEGFYNQATLATYADAFADGFVSTSFPPLELAPDVANLLTDFRSEYPVTTLSAFAYAAAQILIKSVQRTGASSRLSVMTSLQQPSSYDTLVGSFEFDPSGDPIDPNLYFYAIKDGKFKYVAAAHRTGFVL